jgi:membrane protein
LQDASAPGLGTVSGLVSFAFTLLSATRLFQSLQAALNHIWNIGELPNQGMKRVVAFVARKRALAFLLMLAIGMLVLASLAAEAALTIVDRRFGSLPGSWLVIRALEFVVSSTLVSVGVGSVYWILPDVRIAWRSVWVGALITGTSLVLGKVLLGFYLGGVATTTLQGAAGSIFALLLWVYLSANVFFFGAELTEVMARRRGDADALIARRPRSPTRPSARRGSTRPARRPARASRTQIATLHKAAREWTGW